MQRILGTSLVGVLLLLGASGCHRHSKTAAVPVEGQDTTVVATPGAVTVAQGKRTCTLRTTAGKRGKKHRGKKHRGKGGGQGAGAQGPAARLDVLLFRLCEARSNGDITEAQYHEAVSKVLDTMAKAAERPRFPMMMGSRNRGQGQRWGGGRRGFNKKRGRDRVRRRGDDEPGQPESPKKPGDKPEKP